jgi:hypothetical protein
VPVPGFGISEKAAVSETLKVAGSSQTLPMANLQRLKSTNSRLESFDIGGEYHSARAPEAVDDPVPTLPILWSRAWGRSGGDVIKRPPGPFGGFRRVAGCRIPRPGNSTASPWTQPVFLSLFQFFRPEPPEN